MSGYALRELQRGRFGASSARQFGAPDVHQSVQERTRRDDDTPCQERHAQVCLHTLHLSVLHQQFAHLVLPYRQVLLVLHHLSPCPDEASAVALSPGAPHGGTLRAVQHAELQCRAVRHLSHVSAQGINLADDLPFGNSTHGRVARHLCYLVHVHGDEQRACSHLGCGTGSLATSVAGSHHHDIIPLLHLFWSYFAANVVIFRETFVLSY